MLMIAALSMSTSGPKPVAGPAAPLSAFNRWNLIANERGVSWINGIYSVSFEYGTNQSVEQVVSEIRSDAPTSMVVGNGALQRNLKGVTQSIIVWKPDPAWRGGSIDPNFASNKWPTRVRVREDPNEVQSPAVWFRGALDKTPPAPMLPVPFLPHYKTNTVALISFRWLESSSGMMPSADERDAQIYTATLPVPFAIAEQKAAEWATANGYAKTIYGSFFKATSGVFEIDLAEARKGKHPETRVTLYASAKVATTPIARIKD
jgi:hypothetical protein